MIGFLTSDEPEASFNILTGAAAFFRAFDSMIECISYEMGKGIRNRFDDLLIELDVIAFDFKVNLFSKRLGKVEDRSFEFLENRANRGHSKGKRNVLRFFDGKAHL